MKVRMHKQWHNATALLGLLVWLGLPVVQAQQVQVFSEGQPVAQADPANASRARIKDERRARRPLNERPDALAIAKAHAAAMLKCGLDETGYPAEQLPGPQELAYSAAHTSYLPVAGSKDLILLGEYLRGKAVFDPERLVVHTPQCPAGVGSMYWSATGKRVLFATQPVTHIHFPGGSRALWTARFAKTQDIWQYVAGHEGKPFIKTVTLPNEKVIDMYVPDEGETVWVLSQSEKLDLRTAASWLRAAGGTPVKKMDIILRQLDAHGKEVTRISVATGVRTGFAHFIRE